MGNYNYSGNSDKSREQASQKKEREKLAPVVSSPARRKQQTKSEGFFSSFIPDNLNQIKDYILYDIIVPNVFDAIDDTFHAVLQEMYPSSDRHGRSYSRRHSRSSRTSYDDYYETKRSRRRDEPNRDDRESVNDKLNYREIEFDDRGDAEMVLYRLCEHIDKYDEATIGELFELADIKTDNYAIEKYGWTSADYVRNNSEIVRERRKYYLHVPRATHLED